MKPPRGPREGWPWRRPGLAILVAVAPLVLFALVVSEEHDLAAAARLDALVIAPATLVAAALFYSAWRIAPSQQTGWVAATVAMLGVQSLTLFGLQITAPDRAAGQPLWMVTADLTCLATVLTAALMARRVDLPVDPAQAGLLVGSLLGMARLVTVTRFPHATPAEGTAVVVGLLNAALLLGAVLAIASLTELSRRSRAQLAGATVALSLAHLAWYLAGTTAAGAVATMALDIVGVVLLLSTAQASLRLAIRDDRSEGDELSHRLQEVEADIRSRRARMHEVNSTIAGISSAVEMIRDRRRITAQRCRLLEDMVQTELARLERLLSEPTTPATVGATDAAPGRLTAVTTDHHDAPLVDLDETINTLVLSHAVRGTRVSWLPSGQYASAEPDAVAEVINILLDNAAKHGGSEATIDVRAVAETVEITVSDSGPGVAPAVRQQLFQWGARGPESAGQGIGLNIAASLMEGQGGYLRLLDTATRGSSFVVGLPAGGVPDGAAAQLA